MTEGSAVGGETQGAVERQSEPKRDAASSGQAEAPPCGDTGPSRIRSMPVPTLERKLCFGDQVAPLAEEEDSQVGHL